MIDLIYAEIDPSIFAGVVTALLGGGALGAYAAWRKAGPEAESIAAKTLIAVNSELRAELARRDEAWATEMARKNEEIAACRERIAVLEQIHSSG
jgi:hypothetical protein